jgi:flavin reductase (DIM6/NTAB) family NADH-FMN oxidoreductase RutF
LSDDRVPAWARALGTIPSGLFIVTAGSGEEATGALLSFVQQVGFEPPCVTIAVKAGRPLEDLIRRTGRFCVSVLDDASMTLLAHFAKGFEPGQPAFEGIEVGHDEAGIPYPSGALSWMSLEVVGEFAGVTDHVVFCGKVIDGARLRDDKPMVHIRKTGLSY